MDERGKGAFQKISRWKGDGTWLGERRKKALDEVEELRAGMR